ncbi:hypothetical protein [Kitasatospora sp. NPDC002040]|uniref:hypothetical protein n=1 Tax=Kitasatospora sp. NPDC002040 TaxID=3154661 RepID=UPI00331C07F8
MIVPDARVARVGPVAGATIGAMAIEVGKLVGVDALGPEAEAAGRRYIGAARSCVALAVVLVLVADALVWWPPADPRSRWDVVLVGGLALAAAVAWVLVLRSARQLLRRFADAGTPLARAGGLVPGYAPNGSRNGWRTALRLAGWLLVSFQPAVLAMLLVRPVAGDGGALFCLLVTGFAMLPGVVINGVIGWCSRDIPAREQLALAWTVRSAAQRVGVLAVPFLLALPALVTVPLPTEPRLTGGMVVAVCGVLLGALWLLLVPASRQGNHLPVYSYGD